MKLQGSNFATKTGLCILALLILISAYFRWTVFAVFLGVILLLCIAAFLWARFALRNVEVTLDAEDACAFPGETLEVGAKLSNRKFLPLMWLDLSFPASDSGCILPVQDPETSQPETAITETFTWIMPHQTLSWRQQALAVHRGVCRADRLNLRSGDGFGLCEQTGTADVPGGFRFVVYPKLLPVDVSAVLHHMSELEKTRNGFYTDKTLLNSTRDWRSGDSFRDINWRLLARTDEVQVNVHETLDVRRVCFVPDVQSFSYLQEVHEEGETKKIVRIHTERMERMLSVAASLIVGLHERGVLCTLAIPSYGETAAQLLIPETPEEQVMQLLTALAEIDYAGGDTALPVDEMLTEHHRLGQIYIFSKDLPHAIGAAVPEQTEALGAIRVLQETDGTEQGEKNIFRESDIITI